MRGVAGNGLRWHAGAFQTINQDDILFQTTGGATANVGFFDNVSDTRRRGVELELNQRIGRVGWSLDYSLVDATFRDEFVVNSPNHPLADEDDAGLGRSGLDHPGIPGTRQTGSGLCVTDRCAWARSQLAPGGTCVATRSTPSKEILVCVVGLRGDCASQAFSCARGSRTCRIRNREFGCWASPTSFSRIWRSRFYGRPHEASGWRAPQF